MPAERLEASLRAEEAARIYGEILERAFFHHIVKELSRVVGPRAAAGLLFRIVRDAMANAVSDVIPKEMVSSPLDAIALCYRLYEAAGLSYQLEIVDENTVRVTKCPHWRFTKDNPLACVACAATKAGALEALTGRRVAVVLEDGARLGPREAEIVVERKTHMPSGDPHCTFKLHTER